MGEECAGMNSKDGRAGGREVRMDGLERIIRKIEMEGDTEWTNELVGTMKARELEGKRRRRIY